MFLECSFMLNAAPVINAFLSKKCLFTWLSKCFFLFFFYILTIFLFYRLIDNVLIKKYSLHSRRGDKKALNEKKISKVMASKWSLFIYMFFLMSQKINWVSYLPFPFYITNHKKIKFLKKVWNLDNKFVIEMH